MAVRVAPRPRQAAALAVWGAMLTGTIGTIAALHTLASHPAFAAGGGHLWSWIGTHGPERVLLVLGRHAALGLAYWIAGSLIGAPLARLSRVPTLVRSLDRVTLPVIRRIADRVVALSLAVSSIAASGTGVALAADQSTQDSESAVARLHQAEAIPQGEYVPVPAADAPLVPLPAEEESEGGYLPVPATEPVGPQPGRGAQGPPPDPQRADRTDLGRSSNGAAADAYEVEAGDNLWNIAKRHLERGLQRGPSDVETATYWAHLIAANRDRLRSGNPDLIYPGEIVMCPAFTDVGLTG